MNMDALMVSPFSMVAERMRWSFILTDSRACSKSTVTPASLSIVRKSSSAAEALKSL